MHSKSLVIVITTLAVVASSAATTGPASSSSKALRSCRSGVPIAHLQSVISRGIARRSHNLAYTSLERLNTQLWPTGPSGNHDGTYYGIKWALGVIGSDPIRVNVQSRNARLDFRVARTNSGPTVPLAATENIVDLIPCARREATFFYGGLVLITRAPTCVSLSARDLRTGARWTARAGVARHCQ